MSKLPFHDLRAYIGSKIEIFMRETRTVLKYHTVHSDSSNRYVLYATTSPNYIEFSSGGMVQYGTYAYS